MEGVLGIDTSCYTTSLAVVDLKGLLCSDQRQLLKVSRGERGLRQSEAFFQHVGNLPGLVGSLREDFPGKVLAVAATSHPRPQPGSYLPVFRAGWAWGESLASLLKVPFFSFSHQENHLRVGIWSAGGPKGSKFLAVHLSGGTTEVLLVEKKDHGFRCTVLGRSLDLHAGQFVDRLGVSLGLCFPAGRELEELAAAGEPGTVKIPSSVKGYNMSFSGPLTAALRLVHSGARPADVALAAFHCLARTLEKVIRPLLGESDIREVLLVGGVTANRVIREHLRKRLECQAVGARLYFAQPRFSTDNAVGTALLGLDALRVAGEV